MVNWREPSGEELAHWEDLVSTKNPDEKALIERFTPWGLYKVIYPDAEETDYTVIGSVSANGTLGCIICRPNSLDDDLVLMTCVPAAAVVPCESPDDVCKAKHLIDGMVATFGVCKATVLH